MRFSLNWLRELCAVEDDARTVAERLTTRGLTLDGIEPFGDDHVLDLDIPPNRPDCLGHLGVARELSAATGIELSPRLHPVPEGDGPVRVKIDEPELCGRYSACVVRGVSVAPSPAWVVQRLEACGLRSISNVVDASNLVLLELGNPIHFFDLDRIADGLIRVRRPEPGEELRTLDDVDRRLDEQMLLIADARRAVALAGVMGGADSEIQAGTRDVLIEAAWFDPRSVRRTARKLGLQTDASHRFERGVDPEALLLAQATAIHWLGELAGGAVDGGVVDVYPRPPDQRSLVLRRDQLGRLLGYQPGIEETDRALNALRLEPHAEGEAAVRVRVPSWRVDLLREADLVEEVARHLGYDRIPAVLPEFIVESRVDAEATLEQRACELLAHLGFHEAYGLALIAEGEDEPFVSADAAEALRLSNPMTQTMCALRRSLLPALLKSTELNLRRGVKDVRLFEVEHVFIAPDVVGEFPVEPMRVGLAWTGAARPPHWSGASEPVDLYDMAGVVECLLQHLRPQLKTERTTLNRPGFHPGRCLGWQLPDGTEVAWAGELHPALAAELIQPVYLAALELSPLSRLPLTEASYIAVPRLGTVSRDLAVVLPPGRRYAEVREALESVDSPAPVRIEPTDHYSGPPLEPGEVSLTVRVTLQPGERNLTEEEIEAYRGALVEVLGSRLGFRIRT